MKNWKHKLDSIIRDHLNVQLRKSFEQREAFNSAANKANAQLWVAIAGLSRDIFDLNLKIKYIEKRLSEKTSEKTKNKRSLKNLKRY